MQAYCLIRDAPWYRREAFCEGLKSAGLRVQIGMPKEYSRDTVVLMWNRYDSNHALASRVESSGGKVLVAENGYLGKGGSVPKWDVHPHGPQPGDYYALALGGHNGSGVWPVGGIERWQRLGIELKPMRSDGDYILICPSRNFGRPDMLMPTDWAQREARRWLAQGYRVVVRQHPGNDKPARGIEVDLQGAKRVVIWASSSGLHALIAGIPVEHHAPHWIGAGTIREDIFHRLAWAQWTVEEIASGEPFRNLLCGISTPAATLTA
jgi:hypothetical protein